MTVRVNRTNTFIEGLSYLSLGQIIKTLVRLAAFTLLARSLSVSEYGQFLTIVAFCEFFQIFTLPGISKPLVRSACKNIEETDLILSKKSGLRNISGLIAVVFAMTAVNFMSYDDIIINLVFFYSLTLFLDSLKSYIRIVFQVFERFEWISVSEVIESLCYAVLVALVLFLDKGIGGVVFVSLISSITALLIDFFNSRKYSQFSLFIVRFEVDKPFLLSAAIFTLTNIMWLLVTKIDLLMLSVIASASEVAIYGVANRFIFIGLMAISILSNVIYPPLIKRITETGYLESTMYLKPAIAVLTLMIIGAFLGYLIGEEVIVAVTGEKYQSAASVLNILLLYLVVQVISAPIKLVLYALEREKLVLYLLLPIPIVKIALNHLLFDQFGIEGIALSTVTVYTLFLSLLVIFNWRALRRVIR